MLEEESNNSPLKIKILYYSGCSSYKNNFKAAEQALKDNYPEIQVFGQSVGESSKKGCFEVEVIKNNQTNKVWSKLEGEGRVNQQNSHELVERVKEFID